MTNRMTILADAARVCAGGGVFRKPPLKRALLIAGLCALAGPAGPRALRAESGLVFNSSNGAMTGQFNMGNYALWSSSSVTAARYQINGSTVLAILPGTASLGVGVDAGRVNTGNSNVFVGPAAGYSNTGGAGNIFIGKDAGYYNETGGSNVFLGYQAGQGSTFGQGNVFVGNQTGYWNYTGSNNSVVGSGAGYYNGPGGGNAILGSDAGRGTTYNSISSSTLVGYRAGYSLSTGGDNILLGWQAGDVLTTGARNVIIGYDQDASAPSASNELNLGGVLYGNLSAKTIGISTRVPQAALDIVSTGTAANVYAQIWRASTGLVVASMTATGVLYPAMSGADNTKVAKAGDTMTGQLTLAGSTLTVAGNAFSVGGSTLAVEGGNVGVGIAAPDTRLELAGALAVNSGGVKYYRSLAHYTGGGTFTGTLKIAMPKFWSGTMMRIRIDGYDYDPATGHWEVLVSGYNYAPSGPWYNYSAEIRGKAPFSQVRLASDGAKNVLLLGNLSTDWRYPKVAVSELVAGNAERDGWGSGWGISVISSEAGIVDVVTPAPLLRTVGSFLVSGSTNAALSGTVDRGMVVTAGGRVGIAAASPAAALDAAADGAAVSDFVQIWRKSDGVIVGSMSATGVLMAAKLIGDGSGITGLPGGDNLGNHTATQALGMAGFAISGVSTITMQNGSIAIVQPGGTGSNSLYGISMGYGAADNYRNGIGIGRDASNNYSTGVGVGYAAYGNHDYGVGIGYNAHNNYNSGVGIGFNSSDNYDYGVGIGWWTYVNYNYGIGVGWGAASNLNSGVGIGYGAANNNDSGVGIGANARQNHHSGVGIGDGAYQNDTSGVGVGNNARNNYSSGVGVGTGANGNYSSGVGIGSGAVGNSGYGVGIGASALSNSAYGVGIGAYAQSNDTYGVGIGAYSQNNYAYGTGVGAYTSSKSSSVALGYYARANSVDSVALGAGAATNAQRSVCIGAYCVNNAVDTAKIREGYTLKVDSISVSAALPQLTVSTNVYIVGYSSAARYYGDGSGLTGISGGSAGPSIDVSTINASAATPYGGVNITTNVFITGGARLARAVVQAADSGITLTAADFGKIITINSASAQTVSLPSVSAADIGATVRVVKLGAGQVTIQAAASTYIADSTSGGTVYNSEVSPQYGAITLCLVTATQWMILGGDGVWTTT